MTINSYLHSAKQRIMGYLLVKLENYQYVLHEKSHVLCTATYEVLHYRDGFWVEY